MKNLRGVPSPLGGTQTPNSVSSVLGSSWNLLSAFLTFHLLFSADFLQNLHLKIQGSAEDFRGVYMHSWGLPLWLFFSSLLFHYSNPVHHIYFVNNWTPYQSSWFKSFSLQTILHDTARFHSLIYLSDGYSPKRQYCQAVKLLQQLGWLATWIQLVKRPTNPIYLDSAVLMVHQAVWALCLHWFSLPPSPIGVTWRQVQ